MIGPTEMLLILVVILLLMGPSKLPSLARALGDAVREYRRALAGLSSPTTTITAPSPTPKEAEEKILIETAQRLGINIKGKGIKEIAEEILKKVRESRKSTQ